MVKDRGWREVWVVGRGSGGLYRFGWLVKGWVVCRGSCGGNQVLNVSVRIQGVYGCEDSRSEGPHKKIPGGHVFGGGSIFS